MKAASLNHVYRLVWSHVQNAWTVVSETAKAAGKKSAVIDASTSSAQRVSFKLTFMSVNKLKFALVTAMSMTGMATNAVALPFGHETVYGSTQPITTVGNVMRIDQQTDKLIMNWQGFDIAKGESVNLIQPINGAALFNISGGATQILGQLSATGTLLLINPNGVLFGQGAEVNVGNIIASSLSIKKEDFLQGRYKFAGDDNVGNVTNNGVIKAKDEGYIVLLGKTVENTGKLVANNGSVVLASAKEAVLDFYGNGLVRANLTAQAVEGIVKNSGLIQANGGFVQLATNARSAAINVSGIIEANQLVEREGVIRLEGGDNAKVQVSGQLLAKGEQTTGGTIAVTGEQVALLDGALLDASGDKGGGKVLVGGDYQGKNDAVYNARTAYVAAGATIKADAIQEGNGGKAIVWADDLTRYYGQISAQGGAAKGNGGFVEVSGKQDLAFQGGVNVGAANGLGGKVLLDPENIILSNAPQMPLPDLANGTPDIAFADNAGLTTTVNVDSVQGFSELFLQATNNITVSNALTMTKTTGSIRLEANNNINVNADITSGPMGSVNLKANADNLNGGDINIGGNITGSAGVTLSAANITHTAGNINSTGNTKLGLAGDVKIDATGDVNLGNANINAFGTTIEGKAGATGGSVSINANSLAMTGNINTSGSASGNDTGSGGQGGKVQIATTNSASVGSITTGSGNAGASSTVSRLSGEVTVTSLEGNINTGNINSNGGSNGFGASVLLNAQNGSVTAGNINTSAGSSSTQGLSAGQVQVLAATDLTVGSVTASGGSGNGESASGGAAGAVKLIATEGNLSLGAVSNTGGNATGNGEAGQTAKVFVQAGRGNTPLNEDGSSSKGNIELNGNITNNSKAADAVQLVAEGNFKNNTNATITTGENGRWTIYSYDPTHDVKGTNLLDSYDYKQYATTYGPTEVKNPEQNVARVALLAEGNHQLLGEGNGFVHAIDPTLTPTLTGTATKVFDGNNTVTDTSGLAITAVGVLKDKLGLDEDKVTFSPAQVTDATYDNSAVGSNKPINSATIYNVVSIKTAQGKQIFNPNAELGYHINENTSQATGVILPVPAPATLGFASPRDDAGLGGVIPNNPALNTMTIVSLNPAAGDEEDLDAVACPVNEDSLGSTPVLNSGVKLPDGVSSNCI